MIKRTLEISSEPAHLALRHQQLLLQRNGETVRQVPCEDIGMVVVDHPQTTYTHNALAKLVECGAAVVLCGRDHLPAAMLLPLGDHSQVVWRLADQMAVSRPTKKRLWTQLVRAKIRAQALNLPPNLPARRKLLALVKEVKAGDTTNVEARAARLYWQHWLATSDAATLDTEPFRRDPKAAGLNPFLNYGYTILRAAISRAIVAAGLQPSLGLHHANRANLFCLADDLIEPFRPLVDDRVRDMWQQGHSELNQAAKAELLGLLTLSLRMTAPDGSEQRGPLMVMLHRLVASLVRCYAGEAKKLEIPRRCS